MTNKRLDIRALEGELDQALALIKKSTITGEVSASAAPNFASLANSDSLLERCAAVVQNNERVKPKLRVVRHLACSGGTLLSKCLAAMPNVFLFSELHPRGALHLGGEKAKFLPVDIATQARYARVPEVQTLIDQIFVSSVVLAYNHIKERGGELLIRAHSHSDYCVGEELLGGCAVSQLLSEHFDVQAIATMRHPLDAYLSLSRNNWMHFEPKSFEEYCKRAKAFVEYQDVVFSYEKFVHAPALEMKAMASALSIPFDESFIDTFGVFNVTGDSGRSGDIISKRPRQKLPTSFEEEVEASETFPDLLRLMENLDLLPLD